MIDEFVAAVKHRFPRALLQWEDFKKGNAFTLLDRYRSVLPSFNDDIQGTAAVVAAGIASAARATGTPLTEQRFLLVGAGAAGVGIARHLHHDLKAAGMTAADATGAIAMVDSEGLVTLRAGLDVHKQDFAWPPELAAATGIEAERSNDLEHIVATLRPTVLIGTTGQSGVFDENVLSTVGHHVDHPLVMALSNPTAKSEAIPADIVAFTQGRALIATGSPFDPVPYRGREIPVSQCNNVYIFPGVGLGAIVAEAREVTDSMFAAAASALAARVDDATLDAGALFPPLSELRPITRDIAAAVAACAGEEGVVRGQDLIQVGLRGPDVEGAG